MSDGYWTKNNVEVLAVGPIQNGAVFVLLGPDGGEITKALWFLAPAEIGAMVNDTAMATLLNGKRAQVWLDSSASGSAIRRFHIYA